MPGAVKHRAHDSCKLQAYRPFSDDMPFLFKYKNLYIPRYKFSLYFYEKRLSSLKDDNVVSSWL